MKRRLKFLTLLVCCIWSVGCAPPGRSKQTERLRFEHIGPEDASIPPFVVEVGDMTESTYARICVTPEAYGDIFLLVKQAGASAPRSPRPLGTFRVTVFKDGESTQGFTIYPEAVLSIIARLRRMFQSHDRHMPEVLVILETLLTPPRE